MAPHRLQSLLGAFDLVGVAAVLADRRGDLRDRNRHAEESFPDLFATGHPLDAEHAQAIGGLVTRTIAGEACGQEGTPVTFHLRGGRLLIVHAVVFEPCAEADPAEGCAVLLLVCPSRPHELSIPILQGAFGLTRSEILLARYLWLGKSLKEIARIRDTSVATLRVQLRGIFAKTRTKRQAELVGVLARLPPACVDAGRLQPCRETPARSPQSDKAASLLR